MPTLNPPSSCITIMHSRSLKFLFFHHAYSTLPSTQEYGRGFKQEGGHFVNNLVYLNNLSLQSLSLQLDQFPVGLFFVVVLFIYLFILFIYFFWGGGGGEGWLGYKRGYNWSEL